MRPLLSSTRGRFLFLVLPGLLALALIFPGLLPLSPATATAPGAPTDVTGSPGDGQVFVSWVAPASPGDSAITGYRVEVSTSPSTGFVVASGGCLAGLGMSTEVRCDASGLTNGQGYYFQVAAINAGGMGSYSTVSAMVTPVAASNRVVTINAGGGTSASNGLKFDFGAGNYQVTRYNSNSTPPASAGQLYSETYLPSAPIPNSSLYNGTYLRVGSTLVGPCYATDTVAITGVTGDGTTATYTTASAHNLAVGQAVKIQGVNPAGYNTPASAPVEGAVVASVPSATSFTIASTQTAAYVSGGTATKGAGSVARCPVVSQSSAITALSPWSSVVSSGGSSNSVAGGTGTVLSTMSYTDPTSSLTYELVVRFDYTAGDPYVTQTMTLTVPAGNATACSGAPCEIKLYQAMDTYLGGSDQGAGFRTLDGASNMVLIGVRSTSGTTEALRWRSGDRWTGYVSGYYSCPFNAARCGGGNIPTDPTGSMGAGGNFWTGTAAIDPSPTTDNAIGVMWDVANTAGTTTYATDVLFAVAPVVSTATLPAGDTCTAYSQTLAATSGSGTYTDWQVTSGSLPAGLTLAASTGRISGTPTAVGTSNFDVMVTDSNFFESEAKSLAIVVAQGMPVVTTASLPGGVVGTAYSRTLAAACGTGGYTWAIITGTLPTGLTLNPATGVISGTPTTVQVSPITVRVTDSGSNTATKALSITITAPAPAPVSSSTPAPAGTTTPAVAPCTLTNANPITNPVNGNVPAGGVPAGTGVMLVGCTSVPYTTTPGPTSLTVGASGFTMSLQGRGSAGDPLGLVGQAVVQLVSAPDGSGEIASRAHVAGSGAQPSSVVNLYLAPSGSYRSAPVTDATRRAAFTWPYYLGQVPVDANGSFDGSVPIPPGLSPGDYTLQANAMATNGTLRSLTIGVLVTTVAAKPVPSGQMTVRFKPLSAELTKTSKNRLRTIAAHIGPAVARAVVLGYVQDDGRTYNNKSLSSARARNVTKYLKSLGLRGGFISKGRGIDPNNRGPFGRRVDVTILGQAQ